MPYEFGGLSLGARDQLDVISEVARGDGASAWTVWISGLAALSLAFPQPTVRKVMGSPWAGPRVAGSIFSKNAAGVAQKVDNGWLVKGRWAFCSGLQHAAFLQAGVELRKDDGTVGRGLALVPRGQFEIEDDWNVMGMQATSSNSASIRDEVFVPDDHVVTMEEMFTNAVKAQERYQDELGQQLDAMVAPTVIGNGGLALGMLRGAFECFIEQGKKRAPFGAPYASLAKTPSVQVVAGKVACVLALLENSLPAVADDLDDRARTGRQFTPLERAKATTTTVYALKLSSEAIDMMQIAIGSSTASTRNPLQKFARDIRVINLHGANRLDIRTEIFGRELFGEPPFEDSFF